MKLGSAICGDGLCPYVPCRDFPKLITPDSRFQFHQVSRVGGKQQGNTYIMETHKLDRIDGELTATWLPEKAEPEKREEKEVVVKKKDLEKEQKKFREPKNIVPSPTVKAKIEDWMKNGVKGASFKSWFGDWEDDPGKSSKVSEEISFFCGIQP